jgi:cyclase
MSMQKLKDSIYAETGFMGANVSCINNEQGLILIDTPYIPDEIAQCQAALAKLNKNGIAHVIYTHHHFDHCLGSTFLSTSIIAHQSCYEEMNKPDGIMRHYFVSSKDDLTDELKKQIFDMPVALPRFTFGDRMWLHLGDKNLELIHLGGHAESSIIIYAVEDKILFAGDNVVANRHPYKGQADFRQWIKALEIITDMDIDVIVPGHGEICDKAEAIRMLEYFRRLWDRVSQLHAGGCDRDTVIQRTHEELIDYYPLDPGEEARQRKFFDDGTARMYDQIETASDRS